MISWVSAISHREPPAMIISRPANCPADVRLVREMRTACQIVRPPCTAIIPNVKETARYPRAMGIPSVIPCLKLSFFMKDFLRFLLPEFLHAPFCKRFHPNSQRYLQTFRIKSLGSKFCPPGSLIVALYTDKYNPD